MIQYKEVLEQIVKYYPLNVGAFDENYNDYPGIRLLEGLIHHEAISEKSQNRWNSILFELKNKSNPVQQVRSETMLTDPSFTGVALLHEEQFGYLHYQKSLSFHLSVINKYFTIYGREQVTRLSDNGELPFDPIICISPQDDFYEPFSTLRKIIEREYPQASFIPESIWRCRVPSLYLDAQLKPYQPGSIFQALFTSENVPDYRMIGDMLYQ